MQKCALCYIADLTPAGYDKICISRKLVLGCGKCKKGYFHRENIGQGRKGRPGSFLRFFAGFA